VQRLVDPSGLEENLTCKQMLHFVHNYLAFMTFETVEPRWREMEQGMRQAATIDDVIDEQEKFLHAVMESCCLMDVKPLRLIGDIKDACLAFANGVIHRKGSGSGDSAEENARRRSAVRQSGSRFESLLGQLLDLNLRMNFLGSYTQASRKHF